MNPSKRKLKAALETLIIGDQPLLYVFYPCSGICFHVSALWS